MARHSLTRDQLEDALSDAVSEISALKSAHERQMAELSSAHKRQTAEVMSELRALKARLAYYENPHSPPSADSLEWRRAKKEKKNMAAKSERKPGGQPGRRGAFRAHAPEGRRTHRFEGRPKCARCGRTARIDRKPVTRDIVEIHFTATETRHSIQTATCGTVQQAPDGLPGSGSYGRNLVAMITSLRAAHMPFEDIKDTARHCRHPCGKIHRDQHRGGAPLRLHEGARRQDPGRRQRSKNAGIDETSGSQAGRRIWA